MPVLAKYRYSYEYVRTNVCMYVYMKVYLFVSHFLCKTVFISNSRDDKDDASQMYRAQNLLLNMKTAAVSGYAI